jgi:hypothetical protein
MVKLILTEEQYKTLSGLLDESIIDWDLNQKINEKKYGKRKIDIEINQDFNTIKLDEARTTIDIEQDYYDERSNPSRKSNKYRVKYEIVFKYPDGVKRIKIKGQLIPYHTGRSEEFEFEPTYFDDDDSEKYYDENWEKIEDEILNKFYSK